MSLPRKGTGSAGRQQLVPEQRGAAPGRLWRRSRPAVGWGGALGRAAVGAAREVLLGARAFSRNKVPARASAGGAPLEVGQADLLIQRRGKKRSEVKADGQILTFEAQI